MSFFKYPEYWNKERIDFAEEWLDVIRESPLSCSDVCGVMNDVSERIENISRRAGELFSAFDKADLNCIFLISLLYRFTTLLHRRF